MFQSYAQSTSAGIQTNNLLAREDCALCRTFVAALLITEGLFYGVSRHTLAFDRSMWGKWAMAALNDDSSVWV